MSVLNTGLATPARGFTINQSLRFDDGASAYLSTTLGTATHNDRLTFSCWIKRSAISENHKILTRYTSSDNRFYIGIGNNDKIYIYQKVGGTQSYYLRSSVAFRDPSAWYHFVFAFDTTQGTDSNRIKVYANGTQITDWENEDYPSQNTDLYIQSATSELMKIGQYDSSQYLDGYLAEVHFIDGTALSPSSFGETGDYGEWKPIEVSDLTYGNNGFYLSFADRIEAGGGVMSATGGTITTDGDYKVHSFTADGTFTPTSVPATNSYVEYLVIAGGGGGGGGHAGGGGAGGYRTGVLTVTAQAYSITVGSGGTAGDNSATSSGGGGNGDDSVFSDIAEVVTITSTGGGGGGGRGNQNGKNGGSGGGSSETNPIGSGTAGQGNDGGTGCNAVPYYGGGGGGGASAVGTDGTSAGGGDGGDGSSSSITGTDVTRGGGGGGGQAYGGAQSSGGAGGGGDGANSNVAGGNGSANTGGGGGGGYYSNSAGGAGGSGIVIIRYRFQ